MNTLELFMPGLTMLGDILEAEDYRQVFLCGSDASFAGRDHMLLQHGNYELIDYPVLHELGYCGERVAWGAYDVDLYACAKDTLLVLAQEDQPFNCTLLTVDTHAPDGFICPICANQYQDDYLNVYACADAQLMAFVQWVQQQSFYEDTTIVITGDHANMAGKFAAGGRQVYDCFINAMPVTDAGNYFDRLLTAVDIFPTTLAALGVQIEGDQLGIGVNLFSDAETLGERMGSCDALNNELNQSSRFYLDTFTRSDSSTKDAVTQSQHYIADRIKTLLDARNAHQEPTLAYRLQHASTFEEYLDILRESDYLVMFAVRDEASHHLSDSAMQKLAALGTNVFEDLGSRESCIAAVQNGEVLLEDKGYSLLLESFYIQDDIFTLLSAGWASGDHAQIFCPYARAVNARGINIVVYDTKTHMVVDSVCFDTYTEDNSITR